MRFISRLSVPVQLTGLILIVALVAVSGWASLFLSAREQSLRVASVATKNYAGDALLEAIRALQVERSMSASALLAEQPISSEKLAQIREKRKEVAGNLDLTKFSAEGSDGAFEKNMHEMREAAVRSLEAFDKVRAEIDPSFAAPREGRSATKVAGLWRSASASINAMHEFWLLKSVETGRIDPVVGQINQIKALAAELREATMQEEELLLRVFAEARALRPTEIQKMENTRAQIETVWQLLLNQFKAHPGRFDKARGAAQGKFITTYLDDRASIIYAAETKMPYPLDEAKLTRRVMESVDALFEISKVAMVIADERLLHDEAAARSRMRLAVALLAFCVVAAAAIVAFAHFNIGKPISRMTAALVAIARGEKVSLDGVRPSSTEIAAMSGAIDIFRVRLDENVALTAADAQNKRTAEVRQQRIESAISAFERAAAGTLQEIATASSQFGQTAAALEGTVEETDAVIRDVGETAQLSAENMQASAATVTQMSSSIEEIAQKIAHNSRLINGASDQAGEADAQSHALGASMARISEIVTIVAQIAQQTNLLALNATIEAARAGDAGRGFAVVASEVKGLASQTSTATGDIGAQIENIRNAAQGTIETVAEIRAAINELNGAGSIIAAAVQEQNTSASEISRTVQETAMQAARVLRHMEDLQAASGRTRTAADDARVASSQLLSGSDAMRRAIDRFLGDVRAA